MSKSTTVLAGFVLSVLATEQIASAAVGAPVLFAKVWAIGYALVVLGIILGAVPLCWPSRRKAVKKD